MKYLITFGDGAQLQGTAAMLSADDIAAWAASQFCQSFILTVEAL